MSSFLLDFNSMDDDAWFHEIESQSRMKKYFESIRQIVDDAREYLINYRAKSLKSATVGFDIDDTVLATSLGAWRSEYKKMDEYGNIYFHKSI